MYAAHFAAGLAVKGRVPQTPTWALMTAVFLPDFIWIALARMGIEPESPPRGFFDDWSHSFLTIIVSASLFAWVFWRRERAVVLAVWIAGLSHFFLDFLIHPAKLALYPHSSLRLGWNLWTFGQGRSWLGPNHYWWVEAGMILPLLAVYVWGSRETQFQRTLVAASCLLVIGLHLLSLT
jgi:hypothetical protein